MLFYVWLVILSMVTGAVLGAWRFRALPRSMQYIALFFVSSFLLELAADYRMLILSRNNLFFYHAMTLLHYTFLSLALRELILFPRIRQLILLSILVVFAFEIVLIVFSLQGIDRSPAWLRLVCRMLLLGWILYYLKTLLRSDHPQPLFSIPGFWVCLGILVHFASLLQVGIMHYLIETDREMALFWYHFSIWFDVVFYVLCTYALYIALYRHRLPT